MAHIQYEIHSRDKSVQNENLLYISKTSDNGDWPSTLHAHSFAELFYVTGGEGFFCAGSKEIPIHKDSLILINPNFRHTEKSKKNKALNYIVLGIDNIHFHFSDPGDYYETYDFGRQSKEITPLLHMMLEEARQKQQDSDKICCYYLNALLLKIFRITGGNYTPYSARSLPAECEQLKDYIDNNYKENLSLDQLAGLTHLNKYYLSHIFSKAYGISPIGYLLERRILNSENLLKNTDYSITQIADMTGFSSANYFSQTFKKYTGKTASAYRKQYEKM